jgi:hypothetical protein
VQRGVRESVKGYNSKNSIDGLRCDSSSEHLH